jgi:hypothetical protein
MGEVLRQRDRLPAHECVTPVHNVTYQPPSPPIPNAPEPRPYIRAEVDGDRGDLWRCEDCGRLWRVGWACDACDWYGVGRHDGMCSVGLAWRPAKLWQRIRYRRRGRRPA